MCCDLWSQYIQVRKLFKGGNYMRKYGIITPGFFLQGGQNLVDFDQKMAYSKDFFDDYFSKLFSLSNAGLTEHYSFLKYLVNTACTNF